MKQFLIAIDHLANTLVGGYADETLSARAHRIAESLKRPDFLTPVRARGLHL